MSVKPSGSFPVGCTKRNCRFWAFTVNGTVKSLRTTSSAGMLSRYLIRNQFSNWNPALANWMFVRVCGSHAARVTDAM